MKTYGGERSGALEKIGNVLLPLARNWSSGSGSCNNVILKLSGSVGIVRESLLCVP